MVSSREQAMPRSLEDLTLASVLFAVVMMLPSLEGVSPYQPVKCIKYKG